MFISSPVELSWTGAAGRYTLLIDPAGLPSLTYPSGPAEAPLPAEGLERTPRAARVKPERRGARWADAERDALLGWYEAGRSVGEMAQDVGRSPGAVRAQLVRLGVLSEEEAALRYPVPVRPSAPAPSQTDPDEAP